VQAYRTLTSRWTPFAVRWAFPTAIDYYEVLRPRMFSSGTATPSFETLRCIPKANHAGSPVPLVCLSLDLGPIYTPEALS
jgi:hypothetical protein